MCLLSFCTLKVKGKGKLYLAREAHSATRLISRGALLNTISKNIKRLIKQFCNRKVWNFVTVFWVRKLFGTFKKRPPDGKIWTAWARAICHQIQGFRIRTAKELEKKKMKIKCLFLILWGDCITETELSKTQSHAKQLEVFRTLRECNLRVKCSKHRAYS